MKIDSTSSPRVYQSPTIKVHNIKPTNIICASTGFGTGNTDIMHAKEGLFDIEGTITPTPDANLNFDE